MKRIIAFFCCAVMTASLAACAPGGPGATPSPSPSAALKPSGYTDADFDTSGDIVIKTEHDVYGADAPEVAYTITNNTSGEYVYGVPYEIEILKDGKWYKVPFPENTAWIDIGIILEASDTNTDSFKFSALNYTFTEGKYRLIKDIGGKRYFALFQVGPSPITAETPFGYKALEKLPKDYTAEDAAANGDVVVTHTEVKNAGKLLDFVNKAALGIPAMVRVVRYTIEGDPIIMDYIFNQDHRGYYMYRHDNSRDKFAGSNPGIISETIYSFLITDGEGLYLSDCAGWEFTETYTNLNMVQLAAGSSFGNLSEAAAAVEKMTAERQEWNSTRYRVFSPDAIQNVALYGGLSYGYEGLTSSEMREAGDPDGIATEITGVIWIDKGNFVLICDTTGSLDYYEPVGPSNYSSGYGTGFSITDGRFDVTK